MNSLTVNDLALVRVSSQLPLYGFHTPINDETSLELANDSFLRAVINEPLQVVTSHLFDLKHFTLNSITQLSGASTFGENYCNHNFIIIEPLRDHIDNPNLLVLNPKNTVFDLSKEPLPVSPNAIYLISQESYDEGIERIEFSQWLQGKNVITFSGDVQKAVNGQLHNLGIFVSDIQIIADNLEPILQQNNRPDVKTHFYGTEYSRNELVKNEAAQDSAYREFFDFFFDQLPAEHKTRDKILERVNANPLITKGFNQHFYDETYIQPLLKEMVTRVGIDKIREIATTYNTKKEETFKIQHCNYKNNLAEKRKAIEVTFGKK